MRRGTVPTVPTVPGAASDGGSAPALRLLGGPTRAGGQTAHPLTTLSTSLLPSRESGTRVADVWEEMDRAAAWVHDEVDSGRLVIGASVAGAVEHDARRRIVRHTLRVLCVAARALWDPSSRVDAAALIRPADLPGATSVAPLLRALRTRLAAQTLAARDRGAPAADATDVLRAMVALDGVERALEGDGVRTATAQLTSASAMELLVEVAHDMRSPLGSILFLVERLRAGSRDGEVRAAGEDRQLALVHGAAFGLSAMVSDVMELARGGDRLATGTPGPFVTAEVFAAVRDIVAPLADEKGLRLEVAVPPRDVRVGHGGALHRVLVNLVTNALKFTPAGEVSLRVEARSRSRLAFTVSDTGRGIPPRVLAELFQTFRRRASDEDRAFSSAGLGLAICQRLLGAMGGELCVDSIEGVGTTFSFELELPVHPSAAL